jgi:membrane protease YdiL (CAAX protease family)
MLQFSGSRYWSIAFVLIACVVLNIGFRIAVSMFNKRYRNTKGPSAKTSLVFFLLFMGFITVIAGPLLEELLYRAGLIIFFKELTFWSWLFIVFSGIAFGKLHKQGSGISLMFEAIRPETSAFFSSKAAQRGRVITTSILGILCGYVVVKYQSLYFGVIVHALWNLISFTVLFILPMIRHKLTRGWVVRNCLVKCRDCGWEYNVGAYDDSPQSLLRTATSMHDVYVQMKHGVPDPSRCRYFHCQTPGGEYTLVRNGDSPSRLVFKDRPASDLALDSLLQMAVRRFENNHGGMAVVDCDEGVYSVTVSKLRGDINNLSYLEFRVKPEGNGWNILVQGTRSSEKHSPSPIKLSSYDVKLNLYIDAEDLANPSTAVDKLMSTF